MVDLNMFNYRIGVLAAIRRWRRMQVTSSHHAVHTSSRPRDVTWSQGVVEVNKTRTADPICEFGISGRRGPLPSAPERSNEPAAMCLGLNKV